MDKQTSYTTLPEIRRYNGADTLFVHNEPYIILAGEIHNSSASSLEFMEKNVWPNLEDLNMNTVLLPIYWEQVEVVEGVFDYSLLDGIIHQARRYQKHLVLLWFGLWKNSESMYVPAWMKKNTETYFRSKKGKWGGDELHIPIMPGSCTERRKCAGTYNGASKRV